MGRNKTVQCSVCLKFLRSDNVNRHMKKHEASKYKMKACRICKKVMISKNISRHLKVHTVNSVEIKRNMVCDQSIYQNEKQIGEIVRAIMKEGDIEPQSLRNEYQKALKIERMNIEQEKLPLRAWQSLLLDNIKPTQREIIWICGRVGAEGKSWFQDYLEELYTPKRVFRSSIDAKKESILHSLSKRTLSIIDVFMFNIPRSFEVQNVPYTLFEDIKDGFSISTKYDSKQLRFNTPNVVLVFAKYMPSKYKVSKDRWCIYDIRINHFQNKDLVKMS